MDTKENNLSPEILIPGYLKGELDANEQQELLNWIRSDPSNKRKFDEYCEIWITARSGVRHPEYNFHEGFWKFKQKIQIPDHQPEEKNSKRLYINILKYAAVFILAATVSGLSFYYLGKNNAKSKYQSVNELIVPMGSNAKFSLSDGTIVTLNAGSRLRYNNRFGMKDRVVSLEGEAFFNVAKDADKPFIVRTSHIDIEALGTAFNVKAYATDRTIETTLVEGSVRIEGVSEESGPEITVLKPNQKMTFYKADSTFVDEAAVKEKKETEAGKESQVIAIKPVSVPRSVTENVNVEPVISWKEKKWIFDNQSLEQIAVELQRKFDVEIVFDSERLRNFRFTATILDEPIEQVLEVMSLSAPINFSLKGKVVTLSENRNFEELNRRLYNQQ